MIKVRRKQIASPYAILKNFMYEGYLWGKENELSL